MIVPDWNDKYSVRNAKIDEQHKKLFEIAKRTEAMLHTKVSADEVKVILTELFDYMKFHFRDEEAYMKSIGYPALAAHAKLHEQMIENMVSLIQNMKFDFKQKLATIVNDWLVDHIMREDMRVARWRDEKENASMLEVDEKADEKAETKRIEHIYKCDCRESFSVPESIHKSIQGGHNYHCKRCNSVISFIKDRQA